MRTCLMHSLRITRWWFLPLSARRCHAAPPECATLPLFASLSGRTCTLDPQNGCKERAFTPWRYEMRRVRVWGDAGTAGAPLQTGQAIRSGIWEEEVVVSVGCQHKRWQGFHKRVVVLQN